MAEEHFRKLENMYLEAPIQKDIFKSATIDVTSKKSIITLQTSQSFCHALGAVHGSVYFKMLDDAAFFAVNSVVTDQFVVTTNFNISLVRPVSIGKIKAIGELAFQSRNLFVAKSTLVDKEEKEIAFGSGHFMKSGVCLAEKIGYR